MGKSIEEIREQRRLYYHKYKEEYNKRRNEKNKLNRENLNAKFREYYSNNKDYVLTRNKKYREENKDKLKEINKIWYDNNKEKSIENTRKWRKNNTEKARESNRINLKKRYYKNREKSIQASKDYYKLNKEKIRERKRIYEKNKKENDPLFKLKHSIRIIISRSFKRNGYEKKSRTFEILGCNFDEFKLHLESKFSPWMNWDNKGLYNGEYNYGWDIDHIIPLYSAKTEEDIIKLNHYTNLQPLCSKINREIKRNKTESI